MSLKKFKQITDVPDFLEENFDWSAVTFDDETFQVYRPDGEKEIMSANTLVDTALEMWDSLKRNGLDKSVVEEIENQYFTQQNTNTPLTDAQIHWFITEYSVIQEISDVTMFSQLNPETLIKGVDPDEDLTQAEFNLAGMHTDDSEIVYSIYDGNQNFITSVSDYEDLIEFIQQLNTPEDYKYEFDGKYAEFEM